MSKETQSHKNVFRRAAIRGTVALGGLAILTGCGSAINGGNNNEIKVTQGVPASEIHVGLTTNEEDGMKISIGSGYDTRSMESYQPPPDSERGKNPAQFVKEDFFGRVGYSIVPIPDLPGIDAEEAVWEIDKLNTFRIALFDTQEVKIVYTTPSINAEGLDSYSYSFDKSNKLTKISIDGNTATAAKAQDLELKLSNMLFDDFNTAIRNKQFIKTYFGTK